MNADTPPLWGSWGFSSPIAQAWAGEPGSKESPCEPGAAGVCGTSTTGSLVKSA